MELFLDSTWSVSFKNKIICLDSAKNVRDKVAGETRQEYSMHDGCGLFCFVLFLVAKILEAWARKEMKNKDREMGLNLEFKFRIGIKRTNYLFIKYSKEIIQFRLGHESGALMMSYCSSKTLESLFVHLTCTQRRIHVSTQPWSNHLQGKNRGLRMEPSLLAPWSWTAQPPKLWEISSYRWSHPTLGILLWLIQTFFFKCIYSGL